MIRERGGLGPVFRPAPRAGHGTRLARPPADRAVGALASLLVLMLVCASASTEAPANPHESALCTGAIRSAERTYELPSGLLMALALTETGRRVDGVLAPWPWSINAAGDGVWLENRQAALEHVRHLRAAGIRSIDVGCMQVNLMWHESAFANLDVALDPIANVDYAARHIKSLRAQSRDWLEAAGRYHSWNEEQSQAYLDRLQMNWSAVRASAQPRLVVLPRAPGRVDLSFEFAPPPAARDPSWPLMGHGSGPLLDAPPGPLVDLEPTRGLLGGNR